GTPRADHAAVRLADGRVLVVGGLDTERNPLASAELFDPATGQWSSAGSLTSGRVRPLAALLNDGRVLVAGGGTGPLPAETPVATAELFDPRTGQWSSAGTMVAGRVRGALAVMADGRVLAAGGRG